MGAPMMAVVGYHLSAGRVKRWGRNAYAVPGPYVDALRRAGARTVVLCPGDDWPVEDVRRFDGVLLAGGGDVEPSRYGEGAHASVYGVEPDRDTLEVDLVRAIVGGPIPLLAICRGMQVMNVALGGTLVQDLADLPGLVPHGVPGGGAPCLHDVTVAEDSRVAAAAGRSILTCSSHHHQGLRRLGDGLGAVGWSEDGLVEAIEAVDSWAVGVQWHPEDTAATDPAQQALFDAFVRQAVHRATGGGDGAPA